MWHHKPHKADDAAGRNEHPRQQREQRHIAAAHRARINAKRHGKLLPKQQHIERAQLGEKVNGEQRHDENRQKKALPFGIGKRAHRPKSRRLHPLRIRRHIHDEVRHRSAERTDGSAREHEFHGGHTAVNAREHENGERCKNRAEKSAAGDAKRNGSRAKQNGERCADGRARCDAEDERLCQWVLHTCLHDDARKGKPRARRHRQQDARHAQRPDDVCDGRIRGRLRSSQFCREDGKRIARRYRDTACRYGKERHEKKYDRQRGRRRQQIFDRHEEILS